MAPNGLLYVSRQRRRSLLAKMLTEILDTRIMVKGQKDMPHLSKSDIRLQNSRQLALKYIANVTYGYTSASFSGRMPCAELADSIVQTGRETLENVCADKMPKRVAHIIGYSSYSQEQGLDSRSDIRRYG